MKVGDLVKYDPERYDMTKPVCMGVVIKIWHTRTDSGRRREMVDIMWDNGVWSDDSYEFAVVQ